MLMMRPDLAALICGSTLRTTLCTEKQLTLNIVWTSSTVNSSTDPIVSYPAQLITISIDLTLKCLSVSSIAFLILCSLLRSTSNGRKFGPFWCPAASINLDALREVAATLWPACRCYLTKQFPIPEDVPVRNQT